MASCLEADADLVREVPNVAAATPFLQGDVTVRHTYEAWAVTAAAILAASYGNDMTNGQKEES